MATYFVTWWNEVWTDWLQKIQAASDTAEAVADAVGAIPGVGLILLPFIEAVKGVAAVSDATVDSYLAQADTTFLDQAKCDLYCDLKAAGTFNVGIVRDWAQAISDDAGLLLGIKNWGDFVQTVTDAEIVKRISVGGAVPLGDCDELCDECPEPMECGLDWIPYEGYGANMTTGTDEVGPYIQGDGELHSGNYYMIIHSLGGENDCCDLQQSRDGSGGASPVPILYVACGQVDDGAHFINFTTPISCHVVQAQYSTPFTVRLYFTS